MKLKNISGKAFSTFVFESYFRPAMHHAADMAELAVVGLTAVNSIAEINKSPRFKFEKNNLILIKIKSNFLQLLFGCLSGQAKMGDSSIPSLH